MKHNNFNYLHIAKNNSKYFGYATISGERYYLNSVKISIFHYCYFLSYDLKISKTNMA